MNDVIRVKIIRVAKMATKDESFVDVDFAVCSYKKECFYFYIKRNIFFIQCLYTMSLCYRNFKAFVQRHSWINDIGGKRELILMPKKGELKLWLTSTDTSLTSSQVIFFSNGFDTFSFFIRAFIKNSEND